MRLVFNTKVGQEAAIVSCLISDMRLPTLPTINVIAAFASTYDTQGAKFKDYYAVSPMELSMRQWTLGELELMRQCLYPTMSTGQIKTGFHLWGGNPRAVFFPPTTRTLENAIQSSPPALGVLCLVFRATLAFSK